MAQDIQLDGTQYVHLAERSHYNNNYYQHRETGEIIFEKCEELYGTFAFWIWTPSQETFLGRSEDDITTGVITIHPDWD
jgi:hypothetical protein